MPTGLMASQPRAHIDEVLVKFVATYNAGDGATVASFYSEDAALFPPGIDRSRRKPPQDLSAYDYVMRSLPFVWALNQNDNQEAIRLLKKAIEIDSDYPLALSLMAWCHGQQAIFNWSLTLDETKAETL